MRPAGSARAAFASRQGLDPTARQRLRLGAPCAGVVPWRVRKRPATRSTHGSPLFLTGLVPLRKCYEEVAGLNPGHSLEKPPIAPLRSFQILHGWPLRETGTGAAARSLGGEQNLRRERARGCRPAHDRPSRCDDQELERKNDKICKGRRQPRPQTEYIAEHVGP